MVPINSLTPLLFLLLISLKSCISMVHFLKMMKYKCIIINCRGTKSATPKKSPWQSDYFEMKTIQVQRFRKKH